MADQTSEATTHGSSASGDVQMRVGVVGYGTIGQAVVDGLIAGDVRTARCAGYLRRRGGVDHSAGARQCSSIEQLLECSDLIVEAAGQEALRELGPAVLGAGTDLLVLSVGALIDERVLGRLQDSGAGRLLLSTGAIGGLDVLRAATRCGGLEKVELESTKLAAALEQPWMSGELLAGMREASTDFEVFDGTARDAARRFPQTANVAATLALATTGLDATRVRILASPSGGTTHVIRARGPSGSYELTINNRPSPANAKTSWLTPFAVLRALEDLSARCVLV